MPSKVSPPTPPPPTPPLFVDPGGARLLGGGGVTVNTPPKPKVLRTEPPTVRPSPPVSLSQGVDERWGEGGGEGDGGGEGKGAESFEDDHVRWERERFSWSTGTLSSGAAGDSSCRAGGGSEGLRGALCATPARPSNQANGLSVAGAGQMHVHEPVGNGDELGEEWSENDVEALGEEWSENDVEAKAAATRGCGGAWGESVNSRPSTLGECLWALWRELRHDCMSLRAYASGSISVIYRCKHARPHTHIYTQTHT
jgi:hypothetical protein